MVCEGCGDCSDKSNCLSVEPLETEFGRKRAINQSSCNKDYSCVKGFCPSFVTVEGGKLKKGKGGSRKVGATIFAGAAASRPRRPSIRPYGILVTGIGGTGVVTVGADPGHGRACRRQGRDRAGHDGLAQKGGPVMSHVRIANRPEDLHAARIGTGDASLVIGCDLVVAASPDALARMSEARTRAVINCDHRADRGFRAQSRTGSFRAPVCCTTITAACGKGNVDFIAAGKYFHQPDGRFHRHQYVHAGLCAAKRLGAVPAAAVEKAIELNGVSVEFN